jgi:hypothetical protein
MSEGGLHFIETKPGRVKTGDNGACGRARDARRAMTCGDEPAKKSKVRGEAEKRGTE